MKNGALVAMALAELGQCSDAASWQRRMIVIAEQARSTDTVEQLKTNLRRYEGSQPCRLQGEEGGSAPPLKDNGRKPRIPQPR